LKTRILAFAVAVAALIGSSPAAQAAGPVTIGTNGGPTWLVKDASLSWIRLGPYWRTLNPNPGQFVWNELDNAMVDLDNYDLKYLMILSGAPTWCGSDANGAKPCNIAAWKTYVDELTRHIAAHPSGHVIGAFEIWNEPDLRDSSTFGVGWDADFTVAPKYVDYVVEASRIIRQNLPQAKVVAGVLSGKRSDVFRNERMARDFETTYYWDPVTATNVNASDYIDAISGHMNGGDTLSSNSAADLYEKNVLNWFRDYNPRNRYKEQWITEFGWSSENMGEDAQRRRIKNFVIEMTGSGYGYLADWNMTHAFIYPTEIATDKRSIYYPNTHNPPHHPKKVVTYYLAPLGFPAIQQPGAPLE